MSRLTDRSVYGMVDLLVLKTLSRGGEMHGLSIIDEIARTVCVHPGIIIESLRKIYDADKLAKKLHDHSLFIAFAPVDEPMVAIAIVVEHGGSGSAVAAPIARTILDKFLEKTPS